MRQMILLVATVAPATLAAADPFEGDAAAAGPEPRTLTS